MKKLLITTIAALALAACSEQVELTTESVESTSLKSRDDMIVYTNFSTEFWLYQ